MRFNVTFAVFIQIILTTCCHGSQKVILILLDGFRHDYSVAGLEGFQKIIRNGIQASSFQPVFPSVSFTNYYSIATGLYPESHGIIHNFIYDPTEDKVFDIGTQPSDFEAFWWKDGEPVWISAEKQGKKAVMYYWPGCEADIQNRLPKVCVKYDKVPTLEDLSYAVNETIKELASGGAEFSAIYYEYTDKHGHNHGPGSSEVVKDIKEIDGELQRLLATMETTNMADGSGKLSDLVNVIVVSDHGMAQSDAHQRIVMSEIIDKNNLVRAIPSSSSDTLLFLWPKDGYEDSMYQALSNVQGLKPYRKSELLDRWHFKDNDRVPPITVLADHHYALLSPTYDQDPASFSWYLGMHGYDNSFADMGGILLASGPAFKSGVKSGKIESIDLYQIMCRILEVQAAPNNGTWKNIEHLLENEFNHANHIRANVVMLSLLYVLYSVW